MAEQETNQLTIAVMQANPHLGNVDANFEALRQKRMRAAEMGTDCLLTPEMYLAGYPADDLVLRQDFMDRIEAALQDIAVLTQDGGPAVIVGAPHREAGRLFNRHLSLITGQYRPGVIKWICPIMACLMINGISRQVRYMGQSA